MPSVTGSSPIALSVLQKSLGSTIAIDCPLELGRSQGLNSGLIYYPFSLKYPPDDTYWNGSPLAGSHNAYIVSKCKNVEKGMPRKEPDIDQEERVIMNGRQDCLIAILTFKSACAQRELIGPYLGILQFCPKIRKLATSALKPEKRKDIQNGRNLRGLQLVLWEQLTYKSQAGTRRLTLFNLSLGAIPKVCVFTADSLIVHRVMGELFPSANIRMYIFSGFCGLSLLESSPTKEEVFTASDEILNARKLPDDSTLLMLADGFMKEGEEGEEVFKLCNLKDDLALSTVSCVALIHKSTKSGKLSDAYNFFRALRNKGVVPDLTVYNSLLTAAGKAGNFKLAYHIFKDLLANGSPDSTSYLSIAKAFTKVGDAEVACKFCRELSEQSCPCNATVLNRFIYAFSVTGQTKTSLGIFEDMKHLKCKPDQVTYNTIIDVLGKTGQADATFREFSTMKELGHVPDIITYNTLINNFSRLGRLDLCLMLLQEMTGRGIEPDLRTYTALIDSFGRMGQIEEAMKLFHEMKERGCLASIYVYRSLINNLRKAGNMDLANNLAEEMKVCSMKLIHPCNFKRKRR
eukprot:Gb_40426 [translate_table: standard]